MSEENRLQAIKKMEESKLKYEKKLERAALKDYPHKCKKIRIYPTQEQKRVLGQWFGATRWTYNQAISFINSDEAKGLTGMSLLKEIRHRFVGKEAIKDKPWASEVPYGFESRRDRR